MTDTEPASTTKEQDISTAPAARVSIVGPELREMDFAKLNLGALEMMSESARREHARSMDLPTLANFIKPALGGVKRLVAAYRPYVEVFMVKTAHQGERKMLTNKAGKPATRDEVVREELGVGVRRVQQILAMTDPDSPPPTSGRLTPVQDAVAKALIAQGYKRKHAVAMVKAAEGNDFETLFRSVMAEHPSNGNGGTTATVEDIEEAINAAADESNSEAAAEATRGSTATEARGVTTVTPVDPIRLVPGLRVAWEGMPSLDNIDQFLIGKVEVRWVKARACFVATLELATVPADDPHPECGAAAESLSGTTSAALQAEPADQAAAVDGSKQIAPEQIPDAAPETTYDTQRVQAGAAHDKRTSENAGAQLSGGGSSTEQGNANVGAALRKFLASSINGVNPGVTLQWVKGQTPTGREWWALKSSKVRMAAPVHPSPVVTTPTATAILEKSWPEPEPGNPLPRFYQTPSGRWRKRTKNGVEGSMSWVQEMMVRMAAQRNPRLMPTPEACEEHMGFAAGWTDPERPK